MEHFIKKCTYISEAARLKGLATTFITADKSGHSNATVAIYDGAEVIVRRGVVRRYLVFVKILIAKRPLSVQVYDTGLLTLFYVVSSRLFCDDVVLFLRGGEFSVLTLRRKVRVGALWLCAKISHRVLVKEENLRLSAKKLGITNAKLSLVGNSVQIHEPVKKLVASDRAIDVLFCNSLTAMRNPDFIVEFLKRFLAQCPEAKIVIAGIHSLARSGGAPYDASIELEFVRQVRLIDKHKAIELRGFVENPDELYNRSKIFILPADVVYANYSCLEAMAAGVIPVVSQGEGAEILVPHDVGFSLPLDPVLWSHKISALLANENELDRMRPAVLAHIEKNHSIAAWAEAVFNSERP